MSELSESNEWSTPQKFFDELNAKFRFDIDAAASESNRKCPTWFGPGSSIATSAHDIRWSGVKRRGVFWCNPPYGRGLILPFVRDAQIAREDGCCTVLLLPSKTETAWFHELLRLKAELVWIRGRLKFSNPLGKASSARFPNFLAVLR